HEVRVDQFTSPDSLSDTVCGSSLRVEAEVTLGSLRPEDVSVQVFYGDIDEHDQIPEGENSPMACVEDLGNGRWRYAGEIVCKKTGQLGFTVRILPDHPDLFNKHELGLICWA
ncbi:MAG TPA: hypothetical protein PLX03_11690, partial [Candidatus Hydrogenedentes bacterium]|nr:hypothetical protein [Candidatus Hydrogenedentota bacterium]